MASGTGKKPRSQPAADVEAVAKAVEATTENVMEGVRELEEETRPEAPIREVLDGVYALAASIHLIAEQMAAGTAQAPTTNDIGSLVATSATGMSAPPAQSMTEAQARTMLGYRLLRNGLGNYGGHGDGFDSAWVVMTYYPPEEQLTLSGLPRTGVAIRPYFTSSSGGVKAGEDVPVSSPNCTVTVTPPRPDRGKPPYNAIGLVEVLDRFQLAIAAGLPSVVPTVTHRGPAYPGPVDY
jgi:hypothetical protein